VELLSKLIEYKWPGNIRELENLVERLFITSSNDVLGLEDLPAEYHAMIEENRNPSCAFPEPSDTGAEGAEATDEPHAHKHKAKRMSLKEYMEEAEKQLIMSKYEELQSSYKVAKELGISQSQAYQKIKKYAGK